MNQSTNEKKAEKLLEKEKMSGNRQNRKNGGKTSQNQESNDVKN